MDPKNVLKSIKEKNKLKIIPGSTCNENLTIVSEVRKESDHAENITNGNSLNCCYYY